MQLAAHAAAAEKEMREGKVISDELMVDILVDAIR